MTVARPLSPKRGADVAESIGTLGRGILTLLLVPTLYLVWRTAGLPEIPIGGSHASAARSEAVQLATQPVFARRPRRLEPVGPRPLAPARSHGAPKRSPGRGRAIALDTGRAQAPAGQASSAAAVTVPPAPASPPDPPSTPPPSRQHGPQPGSAPSTPPVPPPPPQPPALPVFPPTVPTLPDPPSLPALPEPPPSALPPAPPVDQATAVVDTVVPDLVN